LYASPFVVIVPTFVALHPGALATKSIHNARTGRCLGGLRRPCRLVL